MYLPFGGCGYASLRPADIAAMPIDELLWHANRLQEKREEEAEALRNAQGRGEPTPPEEPSGES